MRKEDSLVEMSEKRLREIFAESGHDFWADGCIGLPFGELDGAAIEEFRKRWIAKASKAEDGRCGSLWCWLHSPEPDLTLLSPWPLPAVRESDLCPKTTTKRPEPFNRRHSW